MGGLFVLGAVLFLLADAAQQSAPTPIPQCQGPSANSVPDRILLGSTGNPTIIPRRFFTTPPTADTLIGIGDDGMVVPLWTASEKLPVFLAPSQASTDPAVAALARALRFPILFAAPVRFVQQKSDAVLRLEIERVEVDSADRGGSLVAHATVSAFVVSAGCADGDAIHTISGSSSQQLHQACDSTEECPDRFADFVARWVDNFLKAGRQSSSDQIAPNPPQ